MSVFRRNSEALALVAALAFGAGAAAAGAMGAGGAMPPPARVVSINVCTDQLALLLAAPEQLVSLSKLAADPLSSAMVAEAAAYPRNHGGAEEVYLLHPDLVLASTYSDAATVDLLRRLGITVVQVPPATSLADIGPRIREVGRALGRAPEGEALAADFESGLRLLSSGLPPRHAAIYHPNGYTTGAGTLADDLLRHAGFSNVAAEMGLTGGGNLPLERLVMADPRVVVTSTPYPGWARAEEIMSHPALAGLRRSAGVAVTADAEWICGTPAVLRALMQMTAAREALE